jgi:hypothetical protein
MKKIDLGQTITILANIGVIAGIVFLAVELNQNNQLLEAQTRRDRLEVRTAATPYLLNTIDIAPLEYKARLGEPLDPEEEWYYLQFVVFSMALWEWQFEEFRAGTLRREDLPIGAWRFRVSTYPAWDDYWVTYSAGPARSSEFVQFMNENVFSE